MRRGAIAGFETYRLSRNIFEASAEAIRIWLDPGSHVSLSRTGDDPFERPQLGWVSDSPIVLPDPDRLAGTRSSVGSAGASNVGEPAAKAEGPILRWDRNRRELWLGRNRVKTFRSIAKTQMAILDAFQEAGWGESIARPAYFGSGGDGQKAAQHAISELRQIDPRIAFESIDQCSTDPSPAN